MNIANIQHAVANCCSQAGSAAASAASWAGHSIQVLGSHTLGAAKAIGGGVQSAAIKCALFAKALFAGACIYANAGWQMAKYAGARTWECAKIGGAYGAQATASLVSKIVSAGSYALSALGSAANASFSAAKCGAVKVAAFSAAKLAQFGSFMKSVAIAAGTGAAHGLQISRTFVATHPKEICLAGGALTIGLAIGYAAARVLNRPEVQTA